MVPSPAPSGAISLLLFCRSAIAAYSASPTTFEAAAAFLARAFASFSSRCRRLR